MSVSIAVYGMSSQVQWLLRLHCADKVARCIVLDIFERYTHPGWYTYTYIFGYKIVRNLVFKPPFVMFLFLFRVGFLHRFGGKGVRVSFVHRIIVFVCVYVLGFF